MRDLDIMRYDCLVAVSGDGIISEMLNGFFYRPDWKTAIQLPIGVVPAGSGNALSYCMDGRHGLEYAALQIVKGSPMALDACCVTQESRKYWSFLTQAFGLPSDVDLGTENLRWVP